MAEERSEVAARPLVVHVVSRGAAQQAEGHQAVEGPGQVVADVVLHGHPQAEDGHQPRAQRVAAQRQGVLVAPETHRQQLGDAEVLGGPRERSHVLVVDGVDAAVELLVPVVHQVPDVVLGVEEEQHGQALREEAAQRGGAAWQLRDGQDEEPHQDGRQDEEQMVPQRRGEAPGHHPHRGLPARLDLVAVEGREPLPQEVQHGEGQAEEAVAGEGQQDGEKGRGDQGAVVEEQVVPERLQEPVGGPGGQEEQGGLAVQHGLCPGVDKGLGRFCLYIPESRGFSCPQERMEWFLFFFFLFFVAAGTLTQTDGFP